MDGWLCEKWAKECLAPHIEKVLDGEEYILFADNLAAQKSPQFVGAVKTTGGKTVFGPPGKTEGWQPIDCGHLGAQLKQLGKDKFEAWMEKEVADSTPTETNWQKWERNGFTASEKRVMITWVFGEAYAELTSKRLWPMRRAAFEKGGCLVTCTGKNDHLIVVDGHGPVWPPGPGTPFPEREEYSVCADSSHPDFNFLQIGVQAAKKSKKKDATAKDTTQVEVEEADIDGGDGMSEVASEVASDLAAMDLQEADDASAAFSADEDDVEARAAHLQTLFDELFPEEVATWIMEPFAEMQIQSKLF